MPADQLRAYRRHMVPIMRFTTAVLAAAVGIETVSPFTKPALVDLALELPDDAFMVSGMDVSWGNGSLARP